MRGKVMSTGSSVVEFALPHLAALDRVCPCNYFLWNPHPTSTGGARVEAERRQASDIDSYGWFLRTPKTSHLYLTQLWGDTPGHESLNLGAPY